MNNFQCGLALAKVIIVSFILVLITQCYTRVIRIQIKQELKNYFEM